MGGRAAAGPLLRLWIVGAAAALGATACSDPCCTYDSRPIGLSRPEGGQGELLVRVAAENTGTAVLDTGTPITIWKEERPVGTLPSLRRRDVRLLDGPTAQGQFPTRAIFLRTQTVGGPLGTLEGMDMPPVAVLG